MKTCLILSILLIPLALIAQPSASTQQKSPVFETTQAESARMSADYYNTVLMQAEQAAQNKQYNKAIKLLKEYIGQNDTTAGLCTKLSILYLENGQYVKSLKAATHAAELNPSDPKNFNIMGITLFYLGNYEQALNAYTRAIALNPSYAVAYYNRGLLRYEINDKNGAYSDLMKARELNFEGIDSIIGELFALRARKEKTNP